MEYTYKYRIYPNFDQQILLSKTFGCVRFVYNHFLNEFNEKRYKSKIKNNNMCNQVLKKEYEFLKEPDKFAITNAIYTLDNAVKHYFNDGFGRPNFKKKFSMQSYKTNYTNGNIKVLKDAIKLPKLGTIKAKVHRKLEGQIVNATVKKYSSGKYYVMILVRKEELDDEMSLNGIGIDMGIRTFLTDNKGRKVKCPKEYKRLEKKLADASRKLSLKVVGSNNYIKQKKKIAHIHEKIANRREDFLQKLSTTIVNENQIIVVEDLDVKEMLGKKEYSKSISDASISKFLNMLEYKSKFKNRVFVKANKYYPSNQLCHVCGYKSEQVKNLEIRNWECPKCEHEHDRDINAAINILEYGLNKIFV